MRTCLHCGATFGHAFRRAQLVCDICRMRWRNYKLKHDVRTCPECRKRTTTITPRKS